MAALSPQFSGGNALAELLGKPDHDTIDSRPKKYLVFTRIFRMVSEAIYRR